MPEKDREGATTTENTTSDTEREGRLSRYIVVPNQCTKVASRWLVTASANVIQRALAGWNGRVVMNRRTADRQW